MKIEPCVYEVSFPDGEIYFLTRMIQRDKSHLWVITEDPTGYCLDRNLKWVFQPMPSSRTDEFISSTRFKYDEAIETIIKFREQEAKRNG